MLLNPNNELPLNYVPIRTLAEFVHCSAPAGWDARQAYRSAMREWWPRFATLGPTVTFDDLILLGDCYYLPHEEGPEAAALFDRVRSLLTGNPAASGDLAAAFRQQAGRLRWSIRGVPYLAIKEVLIVTRPAPVGAAETPRRGAGT